MIDPSEPLEQQVKKQAKIIDALVQRADREHDVGGSAYSLFQSAIALQGEVWEKTKDLEQALDTLGRASSELLIAESARDKTQKNLATALDAMEGGFALFTDGILEVFNDQFKNLVSDLPVGIEPGLAFDAYIRAIHKSPYFSSNIKPGQDDAPEPARNTAGFSKGSPSTPIVLKLKNDRWVQITNKRTNTDNIVVLQTEITSIVRQNRMERDRLIDEQAHFLQAAFDHMSQGVCTFSPEGTLLFQNERFGELLGLPHPLRRKGTAFDQMFDFVRKHELLSGASDMGNVNTWYEQLRANDVLKQRARHVSGTILDIYVHTLPDGGFIVNIMDITAESQTTEMLENRVQERTAELTEAYDRLQLQYEEQEKVEEQLRIAKEEAEAAVSSKTRFFAAASHDLLQPINAAKLLISALHENSRDTLMANTVDRLSRSFSSTETLLHALLDISRLEATAPELSTSAFEINDVLQMIKVDCSPLATAKNIRLDIVPSRAWVVSDQRYLLRSIQNLVVNAIQYTRKKGRVLLGCRRRGGHLVVEVWDTGIGISNKDQLRIFKEFTRAQSGKSEHGMGLGLSIVDRACRHLGHTVDVRSKPGVGSVFSITLPVTEPAFVQTGLKSHDVQTLLTDMNLIVVIIENDPDVLFATTQLIEGWGGSVLSATSTGEAVKLVHEIGMAPDVILADYQLDDDDNGIKSIVALRGETRCDIPAIMITANRDDSLVRASHEHKFTVLTKPVQLARLRPLIDWKTRRNDAVKLTCTGRPKYR